MGLESVTFICKLVPLLPSWGGGVMEVVVAYGVFDEGLGWIDDA